MRQEETTHVLEPLVTFLTYKYKWRCEKTHGSQFMEGFPDLYCMHFDYEPKWIECKVIRNGDLHFTVAQEKKFPVWIAHGVKIWLVAAVDLRGNVQELERIYHDVLFRPPNLVNYLNPETRRILLR